MIVRPELTTLNFSATHTHKHTHTIVWLGNPQCWRIRCTLNNHPDNLVLSHGAGPPSCPLSTQFCLDLGPSHMKIRKNPPKLITLHVLDNNEGMNKIGFSHILHSAKNVSYMPLLSQTIDGPWSVFSTALPLHQSY